MCAALTQLISNFFICRSGLAREQQSRICSRASPLLQGGIIPA